MGKSKRLNRDHAKKTQRPMVEDRVISDYQKCLGIVKRQRKPNKKLIVEPSPDKQRDYDQFFFQSSPITTLISGLQA